jgi:uncharacterized protein YcbK (DUF882 family)
VSDREEDKPLPIEEQLNGLRAELARAQEERDKAISARDALVREALAGAGKQTEARRGRGVRPLMMVVLLILLAAGVVWVIHLFRTNQRLLRHQRSPGAAGGHRPIVKPKERGARPRTRHSRSRISVIPIKELDLLGRAALAPDGRWIALGGGGGRIAIFDRARDRVSRVIRAHASATRDLVFTGDGKLVSGGADGGVHLWEIPSGRRLQTLRSGRTGVRRLAVAKGLVAVAAEQPEIEVLDLSRPGAAVRRLAGHGGWVRAVAWSPDGELLASGGHDEVIRLWSFGNAPGEAGTAVKTLRGHRLWISALAFSPDGKRLASAGFDKRIRLWDLESGRSVLRLWGHVRRAVDLAFDATGTRLASASLDRTALIWSTTRGRVETRLEGHRYQVTSVVLHPREKLVVTTSTDGTLRLWPLPLPLPAVMRPLPPPGPGEVTLRNNTTGERVRVRLVDERGRLLAEGRSQLARALRSGPDDLSRLPDPELVKLLYKVANHFGRKKEVIVISGYRSPQYNRLRTRQSRQVGEKSLHMRGQAIDFRIQHVTITALHKYVKELRAGGVGFYADSQFVHMDVGPVRHWEGN